MKIALLGGNGYMYANAPSYVHANGRGYIRQSDLLGEDATSITYTPEMAYNDAKEMSARGEKVPANVQALADQYEKERRYTFLDKGMTLIGQGLELGKQIVGGKQTTADTNASRSSDNTALIIIGGVGLVAVIGVMLASKKKSGRRR